jgi:DNA-directed RNA polymerase subunit M/transcription elongation factor TFIIS
MRFCPKCDYYLFLSASEGTSVSNLCRNCGFSEKLDPKTKDEALILETNFRSGSSATGAASGITVNEFTKMDPTLPHVNTILCPNGGCPSNRASSAGAAVVERDVIYIKTDPANLKFQYVCTNCPAQWTN